MSSEVVKWGDDAQYASAPIKKEEGLQVRPRAYLLWGTPDPLGAVAAVGRMFKGIPTYDLADITDEERRTYWEETFKSHLRAPHEFVQLHFFVEGVTRSHTHQMVRQRTATFAQESLRFAVKEDIAQETPLPPTIAHGSEAADVWTEAVVRMGEAYERLVNSGIPAEDARGLLPHAVTTRLHWRTNLNDLLHHAGNRLCTQAQFEWRILMI
jgi:flavin-dependent thymidylate synthase